MKIDYSFYIKRKIIIYLIVTMLLLLIGHLIGKIINMATTSDYKIDLRSKINYPILNDEKVDNFIKDYVSDFEEKYDEITYELNENEEFISILFKTKKGSDLAYNSLLFNKDKDVIKINELNNSDEESFIYNFKEEMTKNNLLISENLKLEDINYFINNDSVVFYLNSNENIIDFTVEKDYFMNNMSKKYYDPKYKYIAFTFDDGPSSYTSSIMDILDAYGFKATFFEVGYMMKSKPDIVREVVSRGFEVGNHTTDHSNLNKLSADKVISKIVPNNETFKEYTGQDMLLVRAPYGNSNKTVKGAINNPIINWSVDSRDWESRNAEKIYNVVTEKVKEGDIVLFHDLYSTTKDAIETLVPYLYENEYRIVSVSELFKIYNKNLDNHIVYYNAR